MLLRLAYLAVMNAFALLRLVPMSDQDKDAEILVLRHQITVLQRQLAPDKVRVVAVDRAFLAAPLHQLPRPTLRSLRLLVRPDTVLRWHRDLLAHRHAARSRPESRNPTSLSRCWDATLTAAELSKNHKPSRLRIPERPV